ncbi:MAG: phosphonate C-P lyase system protein PhnG [Acidisphaera sp.]|nr:phosphonate C-P lyase system protein PhnG [Acidisphaera sp.]MBV9812414.1 phosphonate C-P lyase system protein PhnG [Acetobacteraceae bacterium]
MAVLARATAAEMRAVLRDCPPLPAHTRLRGPETGLAMVRGRAGGGGAPFNLGEVSVTRCAVRAGDRTGHAYVLGRDHDRAELAARIDAAMQDDALRAALAPRLAATLERRQAERRAETAAKAAATKVDFFAMATTR